MSDIEKLRFLGDEFSAFCAEGRYGDRHARKELSEENKKKTKNL
jgi:hypothetical protein